MDHRHLMRVARGLEKADLVITNGQIVNVFSGEIYPGSVSVTGSQIAAVGQVDHCVGPDTQLVDAGGGYITPGLIDGHVHIESSMLSITRFAELALMHGTTSVMCDLHEVAVVGGLDVVEEILAEVDKTPFKVYFVIPSHVPFSPGFETTGGTVGPEEVAKALSFPRCVGLSEVVVSSALGEEQRLWKSMEITRASGQLLHGHGPFTHGEDLAAFAALGIRTDHESFDAQDGLERLRNGIHLQIRHGSAAKSIPDILPLITNEEMDSGHVSVITDDILAEDLWKVGYQDASVRLLQEHGLDSISALRLVTINPAEAFRVDHEIGVLAPGREADVIIVDDLKTFEPRIVIARGICVVQDGELVVDIPTPKPSKRQLSSIHIREPIRMEDITRLAACDLDLGEVEVHVLVTPQDLPVPELQMLTIPVIEGIAQPDPKSDIAAIVVAERYRGTGNLSLAFTKGFRLKRGALASSVAHDNHNILAVGTAYKDIAAAINRVAQMGGGQVVVDGGRVQAEVSLPILGLMSPEPVEVVCESLNRLTSAARDLGCEMVWPHMFLSFMTCSAGPGYSITDMGLLDGYHQAFLPIFVS